MRKDKINFEDDKYFVINGEFSIDTICGDEYKGKSKLRWGLKFKRLWYILLDKRDECRYRRQRAKRGYSDYDVLDIHMWFVRTLRPMLENILANLYTHPDEITFEEWKSIIEEMIVLLRVMDWDDEIFIRKYLGINENDFHIDTVNLVETEREKARIRFMELFSKWFWRLSY